MLLLEQLLAAAVLFVAAHFAMGYLNPSAGGSGGTLLFPYATDAPTRWLFGSLERGPLALLIPILIGLAGIAVLAFFLALLATFGLWVPVAWWSPLVLVGVASSTILLALHPSPWIVVPLVVNAVLAWVILTSAWTPSA